MTSISNIHSSITATPAAGNSNNNATSTNSTIHLHKAPTLVHRKIAVLGARAVGKSSLTNCFVNGTFDDSVYDPTIESTLHKTIRFRKVHFATDIVDTAGMDEFSRLSRNASLGVHGYALVFSIASRQSFETILQVNEMLLNTLGGAPDVPRVLVGSMKDKANVLPTSPNRGTGAGGGPIGGGVGRQVAQTDAQALADSWGIPYVECSSKTGEAVAEVFHTLLKEIEKDDGLLTESGEGGCILS